MSEEKDFYRSPTKLLHQSTKFQPGGGDQRSIEPMITDTEMSIDNTVIKDNSMSNFVFALAESPAACGD